MPLVLTWFPSHEPLPEPVDPEAALTDTVSFWEEWAGKRPDNVMAPASSAK